MFNVPDHFFPPLALPPKHEVTHQLRPVTPTPKYNIRVIWVEAKLLVFTKLRRGIHPNVIEAMFDRDLNRFIKEEDGYKVEVAYYCIRILKNLKSKGVLDEVPGIVKYAALKLDQTKKAMWHVMMRNRFDDYETLSKTAEDEEIKDAFVEAPPLDDATLKELHRKVNEANEAVEKDYLANLTILEENIEADTFIQGSEFDPFEKRDICELWEGPGRLPHNYNTPPQYPRPAQSGAASVIDVEMSSHVTENVASFSVAMAVDAQRVTPPGTPKNKHSCPLFFQESACKAFKDRPIVHLGSPKRVKRPRPKVKPTIKVGKQPGLRKCAHGSGNIINLFAVTKLSFYGAGDTGSMDLEWAYAPDQVLN